MPITVEEALARAEWLAASVRSLADGAAASHEPPDDAALNGMGEVCRQIEDLTHRVRVAMNPAALAVDVPPVEDDDGD